MPKDKKPRRRRPAPAAETPPPPPAEPELLPAPRASVTVESHRNAEPALVVARVASVIRTVAIVLIDAADATAEALTKRLEGA